MQINVKLTLLKNKDFLNFAEDLSKAIHIDNNINNNGTDKDLSDLKLK